MSLSSEDILSRLDECARRFTFPMLDNGYYYPADVRLSAYSGDSEWRLIIEMLCCGNHFAGHEAIQNWIHIVGPMIAREDYFFPTNDGLEGPTFSSTSSVQAPVEAQARTIKIRDAHIPLNLSAQSLHAKGIVLSEPPQVLDFELLRTLVPEHRALLLSTEDELRKWVPEHLPLVLRLNEWHHPDLAGSELPSQTETFQMIAIVLATGETSFYQPQESPNTHWSNWPEGGTL